MAPTAKITQTRIEPFLVDFNKLFLYSVALELNRKHGARLLRARAPPCSTDSPVSTERPTLVNLSTDSVDNNYYFVQKFVQRRKKNNGQKLMLGFVIPNCLPLEICNTSNMSSHYYALAPSAFNTLTA